MKDTEFAYAVARIRSNENKLLSISNIETLINSSDYSEALKNLSDMGYSNLDTLGEDAVLSGVVRDAVELIYSSAPDNKCLDFLIVKNDFHNLKALLKCMVSGTDASQFLLSPSVVDAGLFKKSLESKDYSELPEFVSDTAERAYELVTKTLDGQKLEVFLDRKCLEAQVKLAFESKDEFSVSLANLMCAIFDFKVALRCLRTNKDFDFIIDALAPCPLLDVNRLCSAVLEGEDALCAYIKLLGFSSISDCITKGYAAFEKTCDDILMKKVKNAKYQCLGIAPLAAYYFAVDAEVKTVRIILSCKKNGIETSKIRERVRVLYV